MEDRSEEGKQAMSGILGMLTGGGLVLAGGILGRFLPARRRGPKPPNPVRPVCGCEHEKSYHDPASGKCHALMYVPGTVSRSSHHVPCTCRQYTGPQPLPEYYAPEISDA
jgi:hypothetical protein